MACIAGRWTSDFLAPGVMEDILLFCRTVRTVSRRTLMGTVTDFECNVQSVFTRRIFEVPVQKFKKLKGWDLCA